jgi:hypothetical protein
MCSMTSSPPADEVREGPLASESRPFAVECKGRADAMARISPRPASFLDLFLTLRIRSLGVACVATEFGRALPALKTACGEPLDSPCFH